MNKIGAVLVLVLSFSFAARPERVRADANPGFEKLKSLVGEWEGKDTDDKPVLVSYKIVSGGTTVMETLNPSSESEMITMYNMDGEQVALTHYCNANNQPRMRTVPNAVGPVELDFVFVGATNLADPGVGHMHRLVFTFQDQDHFTQEWTWRERGKADALKIFRFSRKQ